MDEHDDCRVIIVGAGLSGLAAATRLHRAGRKVRVIEARSRIAGRTLAGTIGEVTVDLGGQWIGPGQRHVRRLVDDLHLSTIPQFDEGRHVIELGGNVYRYKGLIPRLSLPALVDTGLTLYKLNRLARRLPPSLDMQHEVLAGLDALSAEHGIRQLTNNSIARELLRITSRAIFCAEPDEISWLWFLLYVRAGRSIEALAGVKGGAQQDRVAGGAWQIANRLGRLLPPDAIERSSPVIAITRCDGRLVAHSPWGATSAPAVILAIAPSMMRDIACSFPGFLRRRRLAEQMPMGRVIKAVLAYERPFWRDAGFSGQAVSDHRAFGPVFDGCQPGQSHGLLVGFFEAGVGAQLSPHERRAAADSAVRRWFGTPTLPMLDYTEHDWTSDPWSGGCYGGIPRPGALSADADALRTPCDGLHWAGTETAIAWIGYMDGAIEAGLRAAREVLEASS